jgi:N-acetylmuramoyl-L-alanine amidase
VTARAARVTVLAALILSAVPALHAQSPRAAAPYTAVTADGRRAVAASTVGEQEFLRLDDLAAILKVSVREDRASHALTLTRGATTVVLSLDQGLASIGGRLISLSSPPVRDGSRWLVAPDVVTRALSLAADTRLDVRRASRLVVVGDVRVPRVTIRQEAAGSSTRVLVDLVPRTTYAVTQDARRLVVKFDADGLDATATGGPQGLVESITTSEPATLLIRLAPGFASFRSATVPLDATSSRLVIDLMPAGLAGGTQPAPLPIAPKPAEPPPARPAADLPALVASQTPAMRTIVIDPGHGGDEIGTRGAAGTLEKDVTLDVARRLKASLEGRLGIRVLLTRDEDRLVPLDERASMANNNKADLFISLHANASLRPDTRGAEVFYLSLDGFGDAARALAESPKGTPVPALDGGSRDIELIAWDMAQARHLAESAMFAGLIEEELRRRVEMSTRAIQQAPFRVLASANMPAVLVEMAFLSHAQQETLLGSDEFKNRIAQALYDAIVRYRVRIETPPSRRRP